MTSPMYATKEGEQNNRVQRQLHPVRCHANPGRVVGYHDRLAPDWRWHRRVKSYSSYGVWLQRHSLSTDDFPEAKQHA